MDLWIRSQDKERLINANALNIYNVNENRYIIENYSIILGEYNSEERAKEVLDEIQNYMIKGSFAKIENKLGECINLKPNPIIIYQMPKK